MSARLLAPWLFVVPLAIAACPGSGDSSAAADDAAYPGEASAEGGLDFCNAFFDAGGAGKPCAHASPVRCFPQCATGGCYCAASPGGPTWQCQTDFSCMPDCAPIDDCGGPSPSDAGAPDVEPEAGQDVGPDAAPDVAPDAAPDAATDAPPG